MMLRTSLIHSLLAVVAIVACTSCRGQPGDSPDAHLEGMYFVTRYSYNTYGAYSYFEPFMLFNDGSIRRNLEVPYESLDLEHDKAEHPDEWGVWERSGDEITIQWPDDAETWDDWYVGFPADDGERLEGRYKSLFALARVHRGERYTFSDDGRFTVEREEFGDNVERSGTYRLDGYGIFLEFNDDARESWSFVFYTRSGAKSTDAFFMAGDNFSKD